MATKKKDPGVKLLARWMAAAGWTETQVAAAAGLHGSTVHRVLVGKGSARRRITPKLAVALADATDKARMSGEVKVAPLRAVDLCPDLASLVKSAGF